ncbi:LapA family protein [bacterium]|nr:LapA family protein [bacterium]
MWIIKWILIAVAILLILLFAFENQNQQTYIKFVKWQSIDLPLYIFLYISFGLGMLFWLLISIFKILKFKGKILSLTRANNKLREELNRLRNADIEEEIEPSELEEDQEATEIEDV